MENFLQFITQITEHNYSMSQGVNKKFDMGDYQGQDIAKLLLKINSDNPDPKLIEAGETVQAYRRMHDVSKLSYSDYYSNYDKTVKTKNDKLKIQVDNFLSSRKV